MKIKFNKIPRTIMSAIILTMGILFSSATMRSCEEISNFPMPLTEAEIIQGLKEALIVGAENTVLKTNQTNGFFGNDLVKIPWPEEAAGAYNYINRNLPALSPVLDEVVLKMNRGAETASEKAKPIFLEAIKEMSFEDARNILRGENNAATKYLHDKTYAALHTAFKPDIHAALQSVGAASTWASVTSTYNPIARMLPGINPINTDLSDYTTTQALDGLFLLIEQEELKIRTDPAARVNDILKRVFGSTY
jgi:hypothetical protein